VCMQTTVTHQMVRDQVMFRIYRDLDDLNGGKEVPRVEGVQ
jgi:hypothetical protein